MGDQAGRGVYTGYMCRGYGRGGVVMDETCALEDLARPFLADGPVGVCGEEEGVRFGDPELWVGCLEGHEGRLEVILARRRLRHR